MGLGENASAHAAINARSLVLLWPLGLSCQALLMGSPCTANPARRSQAGSRATKSASCQGSGLNGTALPSWSITRLARNWAGDGGAVGWLDCWSDCTSLRIDWRLPIVHLLLYLVDHVRNFPKRV